MRIGRNSSTNRTRVAVLTADAEFDRSVRATFGASSAIELAVVSGRLAEQGDTFDITDATVIVVDLDAGRADEMAALARLMARVGTWPPVIAVTQAFDENVALWPRTSAHADETARRFCSPSTDTSVRRVMATHSAPNYTPISVIVAA